MVKREKARIRVPAFESWFPICETLSKSLYLSEPPFSHLQTGMMVPTHRELREVNKVLYIEYLEQWLKHRIRSIYTSHSCCYYYPHFVGAPVPSQRSSARPSGDRSCPLRYYHLQVALTEEATEFCIPSFLFFRSLCAYTNPTSRSLPSIFLHFPEVSGETRAGCSHGNDGDILQPVMWQQRQETPLPGVTEASGLGTDNSHAGVSLAFSTHRGE